jgi:hypothetical protein
MDQGRPRSSRVTPRDRLLLEFIAEHRLVLCGHVQALLGVSARTASRRLRALEHASLVYRDALFHRYPAHYRIQQRGLQLIDSRLPVPKSDLNVAHDIGVAWLWLAARRGTFGALREVVSERVMRSRDGTDAHAARITGRSEHEPFGVRLSGQGPGGRPRLHYPDLLLVGRDGHRIAVELELSSKGRRRRHQIIGGYASDPRICAVLYLVEDQRIAREVQGAARRFGAQRRVLVQRVRMGTGQVPALGASVRRHSPGAASRGPGRDDARAKGGGPAVEGAAGVRPEAERTRQREL